MMSKHDKTERIARRKINAEVGWLTWKPRYRGSWQLISRRGTTTCTWEGFRNTSSDVMAITPITLRGKQWWVRTSYAPPASEIVLGWLVLAFFTLGIALLGLLTLRDEILVEFWSEDPRTQSDAFDVNAPRRSGVVHGYVSTHRELRKLIAEAA